MDLGKLGWDNYNQKTGGQDAAEDVARVAIENKGGYLLYAAEGELQGLMRGKFMREAKTAAQYPKVGDWVSIERLAGERKAIISSILQRASKLSRKKAGEELEEQIIATNIDVVFVVQGLDGDFNLKRLQRYVAMANEGGCKPVILLNKNDAVADGDAKLEEARKILPGVEILSISAKNKAGLDAVRTFIVPGTTVVFVGSSGAGKSTLVNALLGEAKQETGVVRDDDSRGRHTTTKRELIMLPSGGVMIDTPGMRELGMWALEDAVKETFEDLEALIENCRFKDCDHDRSAGCAIKEAVANGSVAKEHYENFLRLRQELDPLKERALRRGAELQKRNSRKLIKRPAFKK